MADYQIQGVEPSMTEQDEAASAVAREALQRILQLMQHDLQLEIVHEPERTVLKIVGDDCDAVIGPKGQTLDALQFLVGRIVAKQFGERQPLVVDADGYRERRVRALQDMALRLADKVVQSGKIVAVNPMSAHDRRVVHMALRDVSGVSTRSEGDGPERRLLIIPE